MGDEDLYHTARQEIEQGGADQALLSKAWALSSGDESRQRIEYVKLRVSQLKKDKMRRTAVAAGSAAMIAAPSIVGIALFVAKIVMLLLIAAAGLALLTILSGEENPEKLAGAILAGVVVIYLASKLIEWTVLRRILKNHALIVSLSACVSFLAIFGLWYSGLDAPYAQPPSFLLPFLFAAVLVAAGRIGLRSDSR